MSTEYALLSLEMESPAGFAYREIIQQRDLRRAVFALYARSLADAEAAIAPWKDHIFGILVTTEQELVWSRLSNGIYHYGIPTEFRDRSAALLKPVLDQLQTNLDLSDSNRQLATDLARATEDRARVAREFAEVRENLLRELQVRREAERHLQEAHDQLEERVRQRTAALAELNKALEAEIRERERAEQAAVEAAKELERSNTELAQFAYIVSHDLQEPLRAVSGFLELIERRYASKLDEKGHQYIAFAVEGAQRMHHLIRDLLAYSRVGTHGKELQPTDCAAVYRDALANLQAAIAESHGDVQLISELPTLPGDRTQLTQLFQNLIGNALKFRDPDRPMIIRVEAKRSGVDWLFSIADNGIGIRDKDFDRIFEVFQRLHGRDKYPGSGIGLAVCKKIVERHRGKIWVESEPGKGTTFFFTLRAS
jgi:signal transduction histidine kinase